MKYFLIILAACASLTLVSMHAGSPDDYKNLAITTGNEFKFTDLRHKKVHCQDAVDWQICFDAYSVTAEDNDLIIWLGNSQLHTINNYVAGQSPSSYLLHTELSKNKRWLITLSQPNANLIEHLLILCHLQARYPIKEVLLSLVFDDFRETGIRPSLSKLAIDPKIELCFERSVGSDGLALLKLARPSKEKAPHKNKRLRKMIVSIFTVWRTPRPFSIKSTAVWEKGGLYAVFFFQSYTTLEIGFLE